MEDGLAKIEDCKRVMQELLFLIIAALLLASGCIGIPVNSEVPEKLDEFRKQIVTGTTSREKVHERLGEAFVRDERIEIYRILKGRDVYVIPPTWETQEVIIYAMVVYDKVGIVKDVDWSLYQDGPSEVLGGDQGNWRFRSASLEAEGYHFESYKTETGTRQEILLATPDAKQHVPPSSSEVCAVHIVLPDSNAYHFGFYVHEKNLVDSPVFSRWLVVPAFVRVLLPIGEHDLRVFPSNPGPVFGSGLKTFPGPIARKLACRPGRTMYVSLKMDWRAIGEKATSGRVKQEFVGEIVVSDVPTESLEGRRRVLFYNGNWLGND